MQFGFVMCYEHYFTMSFFNVRRYELINTGTYTVQVRACSLAGCGKWSQGLEVSVAQKTSSYLLYVILIPVLVVVLIVTVLASGFVYVKHKASNAPEMTLNLNYHNIVSNGKNKI